MASPKSDTTEAVAPDPTRLMTFPEARPVCVLMGEVLRELPAIGKGSEMKEGPKYKYRGIEDILPYLNALLSAKGLVPVLTDVYDVVETIRLTKSGGTTYGTRLKAHWMWTGPLGDRIQAGGAGEAADSGDKGTQKALTSAYKYMLVQTFAIATEESNAADVDNYANDETVLTPQQERKVNFEASGATLPEGWTTFEDFDEVHQTLMLGIKSMPDEQQAAIKAWRVENEMPWPMTAEQADLLIAHVAEVRADDFEPVLGEPESSGAQPAA